MLNGRNHPAARTALTVNGRGNRAVAEAESSALYGEYEQRLASELAELLKTGGGSPAGAVNAGTAPAAARSLPPAPEQLFGSADLPRIATRPSALQQAAPGAQRTFTHATRPQNDFARAGADAPPPLSWRHEPLPRQASWVARQVRSSAIGLGLGLIVVLPAVGVLSGRFDGWFAAQPPKAAVVEQSVAPAAVPQPLPAQRQVVTTLVPPAVEPAAVVRAPVAAAMSAQYERPPAREPLTPQTRSVVTVEAFPAAGSGPAARSETIQRAAALTVTVPQPTAVAPTPVAVAPVDESAQLLESGVKLVKGGDIAGARGPLARAANLGNVEAMYALGETFDPNLLAAWGARDVKSDASTARLFYGRALAAGLTRAKPRLEALN